MAQTLHATNPATGEILATLELASEETVKKMVERAKKALQTWGEMPLYQRAEIMYTFADHLEQDAENIAQISALEMGKPISQARTESRDAVNLIRASTERAKHLYGDVLVENAPDLEKDLVFTRREPLGVIGCIIPFNFPIELTFQKIAPALIMGNSVLIKAPSVNPMAVMRIESSAKKAGFPEGAIQFMICDRAVMVSQVIKNPEVDAISMTGSTSAGIAIAKDGAETLKRTFLELGGNDAMIIFEDADLEAAVEEMVGSRLENNGQVCCSSKRFIVQKTVYDKICDLLVEKLSQVKVGSATEEDTVVSTLVSEKAAIEVENQIQHTLSQGATLAHGGKREGARIYPTVLTAVTRDMDIASDMEVFGPVFPLIPFDGEQDAIEIANHSIYGLSSGVMTQDLKRGFRVASKLKAGGAVVNGSGGYRHLDQPFGGYKMSGLGREGTSISLEEFSHIKVYVVKGAF